jgi:hypothetical protein
MLCFLRVHGGASRVDTCELTRSGASTGSNTALTGCSCTARRAYISKLPTLLLDFLGTWVAGGLGLCVGLGPSPPSVHIALCLLCFLVSFSSSRQSTSFVSNTCATQRSSHSPCIGGRSFNSARLRAWQRALQQSATQSSYGLVPPKLSHPRHRDTRNERLHNSAAAPAEQAARSDDDAMPHHAPVPRQPRAARL